MELKVTRFNKEAKLPQYGHLGDAGLDIFSVIDVVLEPMQALPVPTGVKIAIPVGHVGLIWDKSGISLNSIHCLAGVIDSGYRGEVKIVMINLSRKPFAIAKGMKIAQMLVQPVITMEVIESEELPESVRGESGFGSTGKF